MYILGISAFYHDSAAALIRDGVIVAAAQEERFTRKKHDEAFPKHAVNFCLTYAGITSKDLAYVAFYEKPFLKFERLLETYLTYAPSGFTSFLKSMPVWIKQKLWIKEIISQELGFKGSILFPEHHESHAASAFYPSPFADAAFLTVDGVGEWTTTSFGTGTKNKISILADIPFPHSLGLLYSAFTYYTGFKVNSGEYKVMGLAPYGRPRYKKIIFEKLLDLKADGSFRLNMNFFNYTKGLTMTNEKFDALFGGPPRKPESPLTQKEMDLARSVQEVTEDILLQMTKYIHKKTGQKNLCLAGGVALNCVANKKILDQGLFKKIWIQPAAGDAGGALGAAFAVWYHYLGNSRKVDGRHDGQQGSFLGPSYASTHIESFLKKRAIPHKKLAHANLAKIVADLLAQEKIIGWFQGRMEFGPRALGARSIIGDARSPKMQSVMNLKIKFRESFRPFAPSVLFEKLSRYFDLSVESPYMLLVAEVQRKRQKKMTPKQQQLFGIDQLNVVRSDIPAVTHIDYSARIQTVHKETNPTYHKLLWQLEKDHHCAVIVNTSFNVRGEPIVCTPEDAYRCFMRTDIDYLLLENYLLDKKNQPKVEMNTSWKKEFQLD